jgi:amino-acid N-acetyltransferase
MNEVISLEPARASDVASIVALLTQVGLPVRGVEENIKNFLVARVGQRVVGCIGMEVYGESCLLRSLAVHPDYQGRGLGFELAQQIILRARQQEMREAVILTHTAERLAAQLGFERIARESVDPRLAGSWEFQTNCCQTAVCMRLGLHWSESNEGRGD